MGKVFLDHPGGKKLFCCSSCNTALTNRDHLISRRYSGAFGVAYMFDVVVNVVFGEIQEQELLTGKYFVRDVFCKSCESKLGWMYEFAKEENQRHKEGKIILERTLIVQVNGIDEI